LPESKDKRQNLDWIEFFSSTHLTIYLLIAITVACFAGVMLPQKFVTLSVQDYHNLIQSPFWNTLDKLGFLDIFESIWFGALIALMMVNLIVCTYKGLNRGVKRLKNNRRPITEKRAKNRLYHRIWRTNQTSVALAEKAMSKLGRISKEIDGDDELIKIEKGAWAHYVPLVIHFSIILVTIGAMVDIIVGYDGMMNVIEGSQKNIFVSLDSQGEAREFVLPFDVRCEKFTLEYYPDSQRPKDYKSDLVIMKNGKEEAKETIEVNVPLIYGGFRFFQSSYGKVGQNILISATRRADGQTHEFSLSPGEKRGIKPFAESFESKQAEGSEPEGQVTPGIDWVELLEVFPNLQGHGPAVRLMVGKKGEAGKPILLLKNSANFDDMRKGPYQFAINDIETVYYTGLQVVSKPGAYLIWIGSALFMIAITLGYAIPYRWAQLRVENGTMILSGFSKISKESWFEKMDSAADIVTDEIGKPKEKGKA